VPSLSLEASPARSRVPSGLEVSPTYRSQSVARVPGLDKIPQRKIPQCLTHLAVHRSSLGRISAMSPTQQPSPAVDLIDSEK
jgi:hypothetical protein